MEDPVPFRLLFCVESSSKSSLLPPALVLLLFSVDSSSTSSLLLTVLFLYDLRKGIEVVTALVAFTSSSLEVTAIEEVEGLSEPIGINLAFLLLSSSLLGTEGAAVSLAGGCPCEDGGSGGATPSNAGDAGGGGIPRLSGTDCELVNTACCSGLRGCTLLAETSGSTLESL